MIFEHLRLQLSVTFTIYTAVYLFRAFVFWDFNNPFQWIIDIPTYNTDARACILMGVMIYQLCLTGMVHDFLKKKSSK